MDFSRILGVFIVALQLSHTYKSEIFPLFWAGSKLCMFAELSFSIFFNLVFVLIGFKVSLNGFFKISICQMSQIKSMVIFIAFEKKMAGFFGNLGFN
jgi:hypothetical protein